MPDTILTNNWYRCTKLDLHCVHASSQSAVHRRAAVKGPLKFKCPRRSEREFKARLLDDKQPLTRHTKHKRSILWSIVLTAEVVVVQKTQKTISNYRVLFPFKLRKYLRIDLLTDVCTPTRFKIPINYALLISCLRASNVRTFVGKICYQLSGTGNMCRIRRK